MIDYKLRFDLLVGKVADVLGFDKTQSLMVEVNFAIETKEKEVKKNEVLEDYTKWRNETVIDLGAYTEHEQLEIYLNR